MLDIVKKTANKFGHSSMVINIPIWLKSFSLRFIWPTDGTLFGSTTPDLCVSENSDNERLNPHTS